MEISKMLFWILTCALWEVASAVDSCPTSLKRLDIIPGQGWDALTNKELSWTIPLTYKECQTTLDGKYLLPDHMYAVPVRSTDLNSEIFDHWNNYTDLTSSSFTLGGNAADLGDPEAKMMADVQASFSTGYQNIKTRQLEIVSITTRTTARYSFYKIGVQQPIMNFSPELKSSFENAIEAIKANQLNTATQLAELIVRNYGTHVITEKIAGALVWKQDFLRKSFAQSYIKRKWSLEIGATVTFMKTLGIGNNSVLNFKFEHMSDNRIVKDYESNIKSLSFGTHGGKFMTPETNISNWVTSINDNLVTIDRSGEPLNTLVTQNAFPHVPPEILTVLNKKLVKAILDYFRYNAHKGCMDSGSSNFDFNANVDGGCENSLNNHTLGGIYQECKVILPDDEDSNRRYWEVDLTNWCSESNMITINSATGEFSCPSPYKATLLSHDTQSVSKKVCYGSKTDCITFHATLEYKGYWCAAEKVQAVNKGFMFGGLYTSKIVNPVTHDFSCPNTFESHKILQDLHVCLGDYYELGQQYSVPFGGFFNCKQGNPLYDINVNSIAQGDETKMCPKGYNQHKAVIDNGCAVHYCVLANSFRAHGQIRVVRPPFNNYDSSFQREYVKSSSPSNLFGFGYAGLWILGLATGFIFCGLIVLTSRYYKRDMYLKTRIVNSKMKEM